MLLLVLVTIVWLVTLIILCKLRRDNVKLEYKHINEVTVLYGDMKSDRN